MEALVLSAFPLVQEALQSVIRRIAPQVPVRLARDLQAAGEYLHADNGLGLAILDVDRPDRRGLAVLREFRVAFPGVRVAVVSDDASIAAPAWAAGSVGYISKSAPIEAVVESMRRILAGGASVPVLRDRPRLTERQVEVLEHLMCGMPNKAIGRALGMATGTVKVHVSALLLALGVQNRTEAVIVGRRLGYAPARPRAERIASLNGFMGVPAF